AHRDAEPADTPLGLVAPQRLEVDLPVDGGREGGESVALRAAQQVARDLRDARPVQDALSPEFGFQLVLVEEEDAGDEPQRAHRNVVLPCGLDAANRRKDVLEGGHGPPPTVEVNFSLPSSYN